MRDANIFFAFVLVLLAILGLGLLTGFAAEENGRQQAALVACQQQGFTDGEYIDDVISCWNVDKKLLGYDDAEEVE